MFQRAENNKTITRSPSSKKKKRVTKGSTLQSPLIVLVFSPDDSRRKIHTQQAQPSYDYTISMVWKKSKSRKSEKRNAKKLKPVPEEGQPRLKSCLKKPPDVVTSDQESSQDGSQRAPGDSSSTTREQSSTISVATRSLASTTGSRSVESKGSGGSSPLIRRRALSGEQMSCASGSSAGNTQSPETSERSGLKIPLAEGKKKVRFNAIQIRSYERIVGDNPSCTSGPPLSIGWQYGKTNIIDVNSYEMARPYRKNSTGLILSREEREALLLNWGASFHDIVESVRGNIKVKNQRRQTVTNLGKVERIEEAFESATRKLKRALMLRRSTGNKVKRLQEQANLAQSALASLKIAEDRALSEIRRGRIPTREEPEKDDLENYELNVAVSSFGRSAPAESKIRRSSHGAPHLIVSEEEDYYSSFDGYTSGGNSTTFSQLEIERFYRELELEMFGDEELPSMVGQTLELPSEIQASSQDSVTGESSSVFNLDDSINSGIPPSAADMLRRSKDRMSVSSATDMEPESKSESKLETSSVDLDAALEEEQNRSMISRSLLEDDESELAKVESLNGHSEQDAPYCNYPLESMYPVHGDCGNSRYHAGASTQSGWLDSADPSSAQTAKSVVAMEYQFSQPQQPLVPLHTGMSMFQDCALLGGRNGSYPSHSRRKRRSSRTDSNAGPKVQHLPPPTHLSPSHWMEDADSSHVTFGQDYQTITISEDSLPQYYSGGGIYDYPYNRGGPFHVAAQQFPSSFY